MERKEFIKRSLAGLGSIVAIPTISAACDKNDDTDQTGTCKVSPTETKGPFPIKTPAQLVLANIKSDRTGVALLLTLTIQNSNNTCQPLAGALVDVWHCDKDGNYSEYGGISLQPTDYTTVHFLRGRQTTDANGHVSFITIYPGWYKGRAPHVHVEVLSASGTSLLITQIAFPEDVSSSVYGSSLYASRGDADTSNASDNIFTDSVADELATVTGNTTDGYTLTKTTIVKG